MNCEWVQQNITLYLYGELGDDARHELEQHVLRCTKCAAEMEEQRAFQAEMNALPVVEPSPSFLTASRMRLQEALESAEQSRAWYHRLAFDPMAWLRQVRYSPALASVIFLVGFGGGLGVMYKTTSHPLPAAGAGQVAVQEASIGGITAIDRQPGSDRVQIHYDKVTPGYVEGSINDPQIQNFLTFAAKSNTNSGVRLNSVDALTAHPDDPQAREALTYALRYDSNPGVRLKALEGLGPHVKGDIRVRNAVLDALLNDSNLGVRSGALKSLEPVRADSSVRMAFQELAKQDPSPYIRNESQRQLDSMPTLY